MVPAHRAPPATTPLARRERCGCGHGHKPHEIAGFAPACAVDDCTCTGFHVDNEPANAPDEPVAPADAPVDAPTPPEYAEPADEALTVEQLLERGRASDLAAIVKLADKIAELVEDLRERLADEAAADRVKRLVADLEKQLSDAREKLRDVGRGRRKTPPDTEPATPSAGAADPHACTRQGCDRTFATSQARALHERRAHDGFNPGAAKAG